MDTDYKKALEGRVIKEVKDCTSGFEVVLDDGMKFSIELGCTGGCCYGGSHLEYTLLSSGCSINLVCKDIGSVRS